MASRISKLDDSLRTSLQSQVTIRSYEDAVRELIENSADAEASKIIIKLDFRSLSVLVKDTGKGIAHPDLANVGRRHHTSKLHHRDRAITTFGFRGEALHSLQDASNLTIVSKIKGSQPYKLWNGIIEQFKEPHSDDIFKIGDLGDSGTAVLATNLFANMPVRRKQQLDVSEHRVVESIKETLLRVLVKCPKARLELYRIESPTEKLHSVILVGKENEQSESFAPLLRKVFGDFILPSYETVNITTSDFKIEGLIGTSCIATKSHQYILINGRNFRLPAVDYRTIIKWFNQTLSSTDTTSPTKFKRHFQKYPVYLINIAGTVKIDDLLHDDFRGFFYRHSDRISHLIIDVFRNFFSSLGYKVELPHTLDLNIWEPAPKRPKNWTFPDIFRSPSSSSPARSISRMSQSPHKLSSPSKKSASNFRIESPTKLSSQYSYQGSDNSPPQTHEEYPATEILPRSNPIVETKISRSDLRNGYRIVGQADKKFILIKLEQKVTDNDNSNSKSVLLALDQHACDERIRVEFLLREFALQVLDPTTNISLKMIEPLYLEVLPKESYLFNLYKENFDSFGIRFISLEEGITVTHLPHIILHKSFEPQQLRVCLVQHLYDLDNHIKQDVINVRPQDWFDLVRQLPQIIITLFNSKACRSAIMFGDELTRSDMSNMMESLKACHLPFQCAHGRPSITPIFESGVYTQLQDLIL